MEKRLYVVNRIAHLEYFHLFCVIFFLFESQKNAFCEAFNFAGATLYLRICSHGMCACLWKGMQRSTLCCVLTFPQEFPGTFQLLADTGCIERCTQVRNVHIHIRPPSHQSLHTTVMTCKSWSIETVTVSDNVR